MLHQDTTDPGKPQAFVLRYRVFRAQVIRMIRRHRERRNGRLELSRLDDRVIHDMGHRREDLEERVNRPFWKE